MSKPKNKRHSRVTLWKEHTSTVFSITLVLFVFGLLMLLEYHSYKLTHQLQEQITVKVDLDPEISEDDATSLKTTIEGYSYVKHVDYISKEEAAEIFSKDLGDDFVEFIGYNPLYPSLMVNFKSEILPSDPQKIIDQFKQQVGSKAGVTEVAYQENVVHNLNDVFYKISWFLIVFLVLQLFIAIILISNTIKISIYSAHETIHTMQMVGAKTSFIARPFLRKSVLYGFLGALFAIVLLGLLVGIFNSQFALNFLNQEHWPAYGAIAAILLVLGIVICVCATSLSVRRNLRNKNNLSSL